MSEHDFKLNVDSLIDRLLEGMCKHRLIFKAIIQLAQIQQHIEILLA